MLAPTHLPTQPLLQVAHARLRDGSVLLGSRKPLAAGRLAQLYPSRAEYLQRYKAKADETIKAGFALPEDRAALLAFAVPSLLAR